MTRVLSSATSFIGKITCHYDYHSYYRAQEESRSCPIPQPSSSEPATPPAARSPAPLPPRASSPASTAGHATPSSSRSEEHTSELQSLMRNSYAGFCLKKKNQCNAPDADCPVTYKTTNKNLNNKT